jgi:hypothetical protein
MLIPLFRYWNCDSDCDENALNYVIEFEP